MPEPIRKGQAITADWLNQSFAEAQRGRIARTGAGLELRDAGVGMLLTLLEAQGEAIRVKITGRTGEDPDYPENITYSIEGPTFAESGLSPAYGRPAEGQEAKTGGDFRFPTWITWS